MNIEERKLMQRAQKAGQFTDFAFLCKGTKIPVQKVIICAQSKVFHAACNSGFKEATSGVYDLSEYPLELVEMMVDYFYVGHYEDPNQDASKLSLSKHLLMLVLADKYVIQGLESEAKSSYIRRLKQKDAEMEDFLQSLPVLYELPVAVSRDAIDAAVAHTREMLLTCTCEKASMGVVDQISDASRDFLKELYSITFIFVEVWRILKETTNKVFICYVLRKTHCFFHMAGSIGVELACSPCEEENSQQQVLKAKEVSNSLLCRSAPVYTPSYKDQSWIQVVNEAFASNIAKIQASSPKG
ncbi:kelch 21 [Fusarium phyllophilum]|uniref:Kelch 21 n=1 Tax=Fusarium phyllophilum TaxID=47803 RepID=A0A8H5JDL2_9HYPO|nr:kelch 21 [Fusarium phyllophilum]